MRKRTGYEIRHHVHLSDGRSVEVVYAPLPPAATAAGAARQAADTTRQATGAARQAAGTTRQAPGTKRQAAGAARQAAGADDRGPEETSADAPLDNAIERRPALHVCAGCGGERVHPLDWSEQSPERWRIVLRCPDCEQTREGVFGRSMVERLDDELDRASAALLGDYRRLVHANMTEEIELFARALKLDLIGPADFAPAQR